MTKYGMPFLFMAALLLAQFGSAQINDEFNDSNFSTSIWTMLNDSDAATYDALEIDGDLILGSPIGAPADQLVIATNLTWWYAASTGPLIYQLISGDFDVMANVTALDRNDLSQPPNGDFNSIGLLCRNPDASSGQNYVMVNLGRQNGSIASESKNTVNSSSSLFLRADTYTGLVRLQRSGDTIRTYKQTGSDPDWVLLDQFIRSDFPPALQVGICANGWPPFSDIWGQVDYVRWTVDNCATPVGLSTSMSGSHVQFSWTPVPGADAYQLQGRPVGTPVWARANLIGLQSFTIPSSALDCGTIYEYRLRARCPGSMNGFTGFSATENFMSPPCLRTRNETLQHTPDLKKLKE